MKKLKLAFSLSLLPMLIIIKNIDVGNPFVEKYYSDFFYLFISEKLRLITGWISIPIGDLLYLFMIISLIHFIFFRKTILHNIKFLFHPTWKFRNISLHIDFEVMSQL